MSTELGTDLPDQAPSRARPVVAGVLAVLLTLGVLACGYLAYRVARPTDAPFNPFSGAVRQPSDRDRSAATAAAQQFALRMDTVDGTDLDGYLKKIDALLTTKARTKNQQTFATLKQSYAAAKVKGTGKILISGIADLDDNSATVLVAHDASVTTTQGNLQHHYRWNVELVKVRGKWLVDDFNPVN